ncbi:hypothetical protein IPJ70_02660 [Candidatus Campbellbacteria bacterium]|nr:MAG: hypothetical protein IPJ70_02660 [Candidatus Campbellbacteria bacterium]
MTGFYFSGILRNRRVVYNSAHQCGVQKGGGMKFAITLCHSSDCCPTLAYDEGFFVIADDNGGTVRLSREELGVLLADAPGLLRKVEQPVTGESVLDTICGVEVPERSPIFSDGGSPNRELSKEP